MDKNRPDLPDEQVATQRNDLIHGQQSLSLVQKRIFALTVQKIRKGDEDYKTYQIEISDLVAAGTSRNIFSQVEEETESLMRKILMKKEEIPNSEHPRTTRWSMISKATHDPGTGKLKINLHPDIRDMLIDLKGKFTPVPVAELLACRSTYGQRLYEMLYSKAWKGNSWEVSVDDLRFSLDVEDKYSNFSHFRNRILKKAQNDVKQHTNMRFEWTEESRRKGRKITHLIFEFEFVADQMDLALDKPQKFDIWNLRSRLKNGAKLPSKKIDKVLTWLEKNEALRDDFKRKFAPVSACIQQGNDVSGNPIRSFPGYASDRLKKIMEEVESGATAPVKSAFDASLFDQDVPGHDENNPFNHMKEKIKN